MIESALVVSAYGFAAATGDGAASAVAAGAERPAETVAAMTNSSTPSERLERRALLLTSFTDLPPW